VEAGRFELPSETSFKRSSTCLVAWLSVAEMRSRDPRISTEAWRILSMSDQALNIPSPCNRRPWACPQAELTQDGQLYCLIT